MKLFDDDDNENQDGGGVSLEAISDDELAAEMARRGIARPPAPASAAADDDDGQTLVDRIRRDATKQAADHVFNTLSNREELLEKAVQDTKSKLNMLPPGGEAEFRKILQRIAPDELPNFIKDGKHHHTATYLVGMATEKGEVRLPKPRSGPAPASGAMPDGIVASDELDQFVSAFGAAPKSKRALAILQNGGSR